MTNSTTGIIAEFVLLLHGLSNFLLDFLSMQCKCPYDTVLLLLLLLLIVCIVYVPYVCQVKYVVFLICTMQIGQNLLLHVY